MELSTPKAEPSPLIDPFKDFRKVLIMPLRHTEGFTVPGAFAGRRLAQPASHPAHRLLPRGSCLQKRGSEGSKKQQTKGSRKAEKASIKNIPELQGSFPPRPCSPALSQGWRCSFPARRHARSRRCETLPASLTTTAVRTSFCFRDCTGGKNVFWLTSE